MKYFYIFLLIPILLPFHSSLATTYTNDLGVKSITFSKSELYAGDRVKIYCEITNYGSEDEVAHVTIWQGATVIGNSQPISAKATGFPDEVFVEFTIPDQSFNIRAVVSGDSPGDQNPDNNELTTNMITPIPDRDRDRIADTADNCPDTANNDQKNTDNASQGNACDSDDDNDGLSDTAEATAGTNPLIADTDRDGVNDLNDAFPLDPTKSQKPAPPPPVVTTIKTTTPTPTAPKPSTNLINNNIVSSPPSSVITPTNPATDTIIESEPIADQETIPSAVRIAPPLPESPPTKFSFLKNKYISWLAALFLLGAVGFFAVDYRMRNNYSKKVAVKKNKKSTETKNDSEES